MLARLTLALAGATGLALVAPETVRYRVEQKVETRVDLSAFGQGEQLQVQAQAWYVTMSYTDSAGGTVVHAVLDSLQADGGMLPVPQASLDSAAGTVYHGFLNDRSRMASLSMSKASTFGAQFEAMLKGFHPTARRGARQGDQWTDTLDVDMATTQLTSRTRSIRTYQRGAEEPRDGMAATRMDVAFSDSQTGTMETPGGPAELSGTSTGTAIFYLSPSGRLLGGNSSSEGDASVSGSFAPSAIPLKVKTTTTITVLK